jgi:hypothetical protein
VDVMDEIKQYALIGAAPMALMGNGDSKELPIPNDTTIKPFEVELARSILMTGPRATPPKWKAIRKTIAYLRAGHKDFNRWNWRRAPKIGGVT